MSLRPFLSIFERPPKTGFTVTETNILYKSHYLCYLFFMYMLWVLKRTLEMVLLSTHNICMLWLIGKKMIRVFYAQNLG